MPILAPQPPEGADTLTGRGRVGPQFLTLPQDIQGWGLPAGLPLSTSSNAGRTKLR